ncbi:MAG: hypothetical protein ABI402_15635 [Ferruginibacter sp.]
MQKNVTIHNELKELNSPLADISNINVYTVPDGYFASLSSHILHILHDQSGIDELDIPHLDMEIPDGYFDGLADAIMIKIKLEDADALEEYPAFLTSLQHKNVFKVPDGYFDSLSEEIVGKLPMQPAKVIEMKPRPAIFRYAVAAGITGILGLSLFSFFDNKTTKENISQSSSTMFAQAAEILKNNSFDKTMEALGDDEIVNYLKNDGEDVNAALVASVTDEKTLPEEDAYFIDEKTLDNFLIEQNVVQSSNN